MDQFYFKVTSKIAMLTVKLAKETYFGKTLMRNCTVRGTREQPGEASRIKTVFDMPFP